MTIRDANDDIRCCCTCEHNIRIWQNGYCITRCDIDYHYIGYLSCFGDVCDEWVLSEFEKNAGKEPYKGDEQDE